MRNYGARKRLPGVARMGLAMFYHHVVAARAYSRSFWGFEADASDNIVAENVSNSRNWLVNIGWKLLSAMSVYDMSIPNESQYRAWLAGQWELWRGDAGGGPIQALAMEKTEYVPGDSDMRNMFLVDVNKVSRAGLNWGKHD